MKTLQGNKKEGLGKPLQGPIVGFGPGAGAPRARHSSLLGPTKTRSKEGSVDR